MSPETHQLLEDALAAIRKANATAETLQVNEFITTLDERASMHSTIRVECSVAAGLLAQVIESAK